MLLSLISMLANATFLIVGGLSHGFLATEVEMQACAASLIMTFVMMYQTFFILALLTTIFEYKHIHCAQKWRLVTNLFTFPIFMFSYIPITVAALFLRSTGCPRSTPLTLPSTRSCRAPSNHDQNHHEGDRHLCGGFCF